MLFVAIGLVAALALSGMLGCTSSVGGEVTEVAVGDSFSFSLDSNPSTGYSWSAHFDPEFLERIKKQKINHWLKLSSTAEMIMRLAQNGWKRS